MEARDGMITVHGCALNVRQSIREFLHECFILDGALEALGDDASFLESGIIDSTGVLELVLFAEETFGIEVADDEVTPTNFDSVNRLATYLGNKVANPGISSESGRQPHARAPLSGAERRALS